VDLRHTPPFLHRSACSARERQIGRGAFVSTEARLACPVGIPEMACRAEARQGEASYSDTLSYGSLLNAEFEVRNAEFPKAVSFSFRISHSSLRT
jgi:hypothetical protein